ncbi:hypothetical protein M758_9G083000 [Ceratodon purpureus]|nr:hypothetical protein M758_9G083000 [Ceratodon purpureus]
MWSHYRWWSLETVAVVTGGDKGIGLEIVRRLALEGLTVILTARDEARGLQSTPESLYAQGLQNVVFHMLDIGNGESRTQFVEWIQKAYGGVDIFVNNAAVFHNDNVYETAVETVNIKPGVRVYKTGTNSHHLEPYSCEASPPLSELSSNQSSRSRYFHSEVRKEEVTSGLRRGVPI